MKKVIVVGGGLAGISAGIRLMEKRPGTQVTLHHLGHNLGGKAHSYRDDSGFNIDHGFHTLNSRYERMLGTMERAGIKLDRALVKAGDTFWYEPDEEGMLRGPGRTPSETSRKDQQATMQMFQKNMSTILQDEDILQYDDICWAEFTIERGVDRAITKKRSSRFSRDALFNWPDEVSAYITMKSIRMIMGGYGNLTNGSYNEQIIMPLIKYFKRLGGEVQLYSKLVEVLHDGGRVTGLRFAQPDFHYHNHGETQWDREVKVLPDINEVTDFDHAIIAVPVDSLRELNKGDAGFWRGFPGIENIQSVATLTLSTWTEKPVFEWIREGTSAPESINLLDEPMPMVIDYKYIRDEYKYNKNYGSVLQWCGQETTFEERSDEEMIEKAYDCLATIPGVTHPREAGIIHEHFNRNTANHERYLLTDPGTVKFRPHSKTHLSNMFLAGDWIRNDIEVPTMEGAFCSGFTAVDELLKVF